MDFDTAIYAPDARYDYGEDRTQALGLIDGRLHMLAIHHAWRYPAGDLTAKGQPKRGKTL